MATSGARPELLVIAGPTASGKSALAQRIAREINGEIISADSWQVYKGFDIGTSKPSKKEQGEVRHHLIDVAEAPKGFNAPKFKELALAAIADIKNRGKLPILAGGTGLYIDSVLYDFGFLPNLGPGARAKLDAMELKELLVLAESLRIDLSMIDIRNHRRVVRAIEAGGQKPTRGKLMSGALLVGLKLSPDELKQRIKQRVDQMVAEGLEQEVKSLADRYGWETEPMKGIGYQQWRAYFEDSASREEVIDRIISATNGLAKRQMTWFKRNKDIKWFNSSDDAYASLTKQL